MLLTVLYDDVCPLCRRFRDWLALQPCLVPLDLVPAGSEEARRRFPVLDHRRTQQEITVVGDDGAVWTKEHAWVMCLWATVAHRGLAERLARPHLMPVARAAAQTAAGLRRVSTGTLPGAGEEDGYIDDCVGTCTPYPQG
jgi:predicted DCC family thiol-disulfide oxidoreductase YuxK